MIEVNDLGIELEKKKILSGVNLKIKTNEIYVILGPSGCGKSVLLKNIIGLMKPNFGNIFVDGTDIVSCSRKELESIRRKFGFLFQHSALFDSMTIEENLQFPLLQHTKLTEYQIIEKVNEKLKLVGLNNVNKKKPSELSGGMQKRVALARSIILEPDYIFYDEPTTGLDPIMSSIINELIINLNNRLGTTSIIVTHDMRSAFTIADRIGLLYSGKIMVEGSNDEMKKNQNPYLRQFLEGKTEGPIKLSVKE